MNDPATPLQVVKVYIVQEYTGWDDEAGATTRAVYTDQSLAEGAVSLLGTKGELLEMNVSAAPAQEAEQLILHGAVRIAPKVYMDFRGGPLQRGQVVSRRETVVDYGYPGFDRDEVRRFTSYGWGIDGGGLEATFISVLVAGIDHDAVKARFDEEMANASKLRWDTP